MLVYKIYDVNNASKFYIGSTKNLVKRIQRHKSRCNKNDGRVLYKYIRDNGGWDCFNFEVIEECLNYKNREIELIRTLKPPLNMMLYNFDRCKNSRDYYNKNSDKVKKNVNNYRKKNIDKIRDYDRRRTVYNKSWGGDRRWCNNLLLIKMDLFD